MLGDVVRLGLGDRVPADMRIIASSELKVETSSLTGETDAIGLDAAGDARAQALFRTPTPHLL